MLILPFIRRVINVANLYSCHVKVSFRNPNAYSIYKYSSILFLLVNLIYYFLLSLISYLPNIFVLLVTALQLSFLYVSYILHTHADTHKHIHRHHLVIIQPRIFSFSVISTYEEPVRGWTDSVYGPTGLVVGIGTGVSR